MKRAMAREIEKAGSKREQTARTTPINIDKNEASESEDESISPTRNSANVTFTPDPTSNNVINTAALRGWESSFATIQAADKEVNK